MNKEQLKKLEKDLWSAADGMRANSGLGPSEYATPVLGLLFLRFADNQYRKYEKQILEEYNKLKGSRREREISDIAIEKCGFYLPDHARYDYLLNLPDQENIVNAIKAAMEAIEKFKPELEGTLPKEAYHSFNEGNDENKKIPKKLLREFSNIPTDSESDLFGQVYEYFLGQFALAEGQDEGAFFTPSSVVKLMVEFIEPKKGTVYDPACGSGGMFVQVAHYVRRHYGTSDSAISEDLYVYGQENKKARVNLAKMNLSLNGLRGEIKEANSYYDDPFKSFEKFDYVLANPPFNVDDVSYSGIAHDKRFHTYGLPRNKTKTGKKDDGKETVPNGNYLWINLFATSLKSEGRAGLVMANSASDARHSEADIRKTLIENNLIYGMVTLPSNMFYTVTLPATLWFFDKAKKDDRMLFIDARNIFTQIDRAHREFSSEQVQNIAIISHLRRGNRERFTSLIRHYFEDGMNKLTEVAPKVKPIAEEIANYLDSAEAKSAISDFLGQWKELSKLNEAFEKHQESTKSLEDISKLNQSQQELREKLDPFFDKIHLDLKTLDKVVRKTEKETSDTAKLSGTRNGSDRQLKSIKVKISELHAEVRLAEEYFKHILWLQERFPKAEYEDVTGLCKLATLEEVKEQDYSLNPGRYVGVVIEEDGKSEEEFIEEISLFEKQLVDLTLRSNDLLSTIRNNLGVLISE